MGTGRRRGCRRWYSVFALTGNATQFAPSDTAAINGNDNLTSFGMDYWGDAAWSNVNDPAAGPGSLGDYFNAIVRVKLEFSGSTPQLAVTGWFQGSTFTAGSRTPAIWTSVASSPLVLPIIGGRQLVAFVPKNGNIFVLNSQNLGNFSNPLTRQSNSPMRPTPAPHSDTKAAIAFLQTPDGRNILIVGADTNGSMAASPPSSSTPPRRRRP